MDKHNNIRVLINRMENAFYRMDYAGVLHASASAFETLAKDIIGMPSIQDKTFNSFRDKYIQVSLLPNELKDYVIYVYNLRNKTPLAGHGSTDIPDISRNTAISIVEVTKFIVDLEYKLQNKNIETLNQKTSNNFLKAYLLRSLKGHKNWVWGVAFNPQGQTLVSGSTDGVVCVWQFVDEEKMYWLGHSNTEAVFSVAFSPDGITVASGHSPNAIRLWNVKDDKTVQKIQTPSIPTQLSFDNQGKLLASYCDKGIIQVWDVTRRQEIQTILGHKVVAFSSNLNFFASFANANVSIYDLTNGELIRKLDEHIEFVERLAFSPDNHLLAVAKENHTIDIWDLDNNVKLYSLENHTGEIKSLKFSPNSYTLASGGKDEKTCLWDLRKGELMQVLQASASIRSIDFHPLGNIVAIGTGEHDALKMDKMDGVIDVWLIA